YYNIPYYYRLQDTSRNPTRTLSHWRLSFCVCRVGRAYQNQRRLDAEAKNLQVQAAQFSKQTAQWLSMVENFNQALKEIGDVENWARSIESDMQTIATALEYAYKGSSQPQS
uniref:biogenesis of lysosome-related organelles complex 1 subunit 1-like n=1 Tax=Myxine glutinosa TaxID=7769 RepID=UPI00358EF516